MNTLLATLNQLTLGEDGVFRSDEEQAFNYSDGEQAEQKLHRILSETQDLGSDSADLDNQIDDWPTEYHLSSSRANLLRSLNLDGIQNVLELGCGCGSITRYLGEQAHLTVDAVEGSSVRAGLAALRCRGLDNVNIHTGNFNQLKFPENHYDLVLFVGVTEYAGRFSERATDQDALQDLLSLAKESLTEEGVALVAIENRTGLKYMLGASEDHYGQAYIGIDNYPDSTGIRTYTKSEWLQILTNSKFSASQFAYPFPDYKVPTLLINEDADELPAGCVDALTKIQSRDYLAPFNLGEQEPRLWQSIVEANCLGELSNSFLILLGQNEQRLRQILKPGLVEYPPPINNRLPKTVAEQNPTSEPSARLAAKLESVRAENSALRQQNQNLEHQLATISLSRIWKLRNRLRAWFR